jgi:hypothetical protein
MIAGGRQPAHIDNSQVAKPRRGLKKPQDFSGKGAGRRIGFNRDRCAVVEIGLLPVRNRESIRDRRRM